MKNTLKRAFAITMSALTLVVAGACNNKNNADGPIILENVTQAKNVILFIGDGMGPNQIKAGKLFKGEELYLQKFPYQTLVETRSASDEITDSAAASTALATGIRTTNGVVGRTVDGEDLTTIIDIASSMGKRTGIIATEEIAGATLMGFAAHADSRNHKEDLLESAATSGNVNLFAGETMRFSYQEIFKEAGYTQLTDVDAISQSQSDKIFGTYFIKSNAPSMSAELSQVAFDRLVKEALEYLSQDEDGFFLMAEGSHIDHGGHDNDIKYMLNELLAFDEGVQAALKWAKDRDDTVVIVTADHETGGLQLNDGITYEHLKTAYDGDGKSEYFAWTTTGHTSTNVYCLINGADIAFQNYSFGRNDLIKNTDIFAIVKGLLGA